MLGWNIFQRKWFEARQLQPDEWKKEIKSCARAWRDLSGDNREPFEAEAAHEQSLRDEARFERFPVKAESKAETDDAVPLPASASLRKNALSHLSESRTIHSYKHFQDETANLFSRWNGGVSDSQGCLRLDHINLDLSNLNLEQKWDDALQGSVEEFSWSKSNLDMAGCKHHVCHETHGCCHKCPHVQLAGKYVQAMNRALSEGFLAGSV